MVFRSGDGLHGGLGRFFAQARGELILHVRQLGWLTAIPRSKGHDGKEQRHPSRLDTFRAGGVEPALPELTTPYMVDMLLEAGPAGHGAMGPTPLTWGEIGEWQRQTFQCLLAWEVRTLRAMSVAYLAEPHAAEAVDQPPPWRAIAAPVDREANERQLRAVLG